MRPTVQIIFTHKKHIFYHAKAVEVAEDIVEEYGRSWAADLYRRHNREIVVLQHTGHLATIKEVLEIHLITEALKKG